MATRFGIQWAKDHYGAAWKTATVLGCIDKAVGKGRWLVMWDGDHDPLESSTAHLRLVAPAAGGAAAGDSAAADDDVVLSAEQSTEEFTYGEEDHLVSDTEEYEVHPLPLPLPFSVGWVRVCMQTGVRGGRAMFPGQAWLDLGCRWPVRGVCGVCGGTSPSPPNCISPQLHARLEVVAATAPTTAPMATLTTAPMVTRRARRMCRSSSRARNGPTSTTSPSARRMPRA